MHMSSERRAATSALVATLEVINPPLSTLLAFGVVADGSGTAAVATRIIGGKVVVVTNTKRLHTCLVGSTVSSSPSDLCISCNIHGNFLLHDSGKYFSFE